MNQEIKVIKKKILSEMLSTRSEKYKWFLKALNSFKYITLSEKKGDLLESYYFLMRYIDDVVDGDLDLPKGYSTREEFVNDRINFALGLTSLEDITNKLIAHCYNLARELNLDISQETTDILNCMLFDARRVGKFYSFSENELYHHFYKLDIRGTIQGSLKIFGDNPKKYQLLEPLGIASRIYYNLRDFEEDLRAGYINISNEDRGRLDIFYFDKGRALEEPKRSIPIDLYGVEEWFEEQAKKGLTLIEQHRAMLKQNSFKKSGLIALKIVYENPAKEFFEEVLAKKI